MIFCVNFTWSFIYVLPNNFEKNLEKIKIADNRPIHDYVNSGNLAMLGYSWCAAYPIGTSDKGKFEILGVYPVGKYRTKN